MGSTSLVSFDSTRGVTFWHRRYVLKCFFKIFAFCSSLLRPLTSLKETYRASSPVVPVAVFRDSCALPARRSTGQ